MSGRDEASEESDPPADDGRRDDPGSGDHAPEDASARGADDDPSFWADVAARLDDARSWIGRQSRWKADAIVILGTLALVYALFYALGTGQGLDTNGIVNTLARLTFLAAAYAILVLALNLHWGYAGLFNIGVAGFMSVAVFTLAIVSGGEGVGLGYPIWAGMIAGMLAAAALGALAALPALRLRADYFAIVTLGIAEIVRYMMKSQWLAERQLFGQTVGLDGSAPVQVPSAQEYVYKLFTVNGSPRGDETFLGAQFFVIGEQLGLERTTVMAWAYALFLVVFVVLVYVLLTRLAFSPFGRVLKAIREDEGAARALGKPTGRFKIYSFVLGCALMGLGGMLWQASRFTVGADAFMPILTFYVFVALIVGGSGSNAGSIVGGIAFVGLLLEGPRQLQRVITEHLDVPDTNTIYEGAAAFLEVGIWTYELSVGGLEVGIPFPAMTVNAMPFLGYAVGNIDLLQRMFVGVVLILLMLRRPDGLLGHRKEIAAATDVARPGGEADE